MLPILWRMQLRVFRIILLLGDISLFFTAIILSLLLRHLSFPDPEFLALHFVYFSPLIVLWVLVFYLFGLYSRQIVFFKKRILSILLLAQGINILFLASIFFFFLNLPIEPKLVLLIYFVISSIILIFWRIWIFPRIFNSFNLSLITFRSSSRELELFKSLRDNSIFDINIKQIDFFDYTKNPDKFKKVFLNASVFLQDDNLKDFIKLSLFTKNFPKINIIYGDEFYTFIGRIPEFEWGNIKNILPDKGSLKYRLYIFSKRLIDIFLSIIFLPIILFAIFVISLLIYFIDGRPIFYFSKRRGYLGNEFTIYKFRTMTGTDSGTDALRSKLKVTKLGAALRSARLDELPQIFNILKGDMSFVGPRPEILELAAIYEKNIDLYFLRYLVKPGLTGWAQLVQEEHPHHGLDINLTKRKLEYDLFYLKEASLLLDFNIFLQTILIVLGLKGR